MSKWSGKFLTTLKDAGVGPWCVYNADQTGLFYTKLPNSLYVPIENRKVYKGAKQMKSKNSITLMIFTSADGKKLPLAVVGKSKKPHFFNLCDGNPTFSYIIQANSWFDKPITRWWINCVFWPQHMSVNGDVNAVLFIYNCRVQTGMNPAQIADRLTVVYLSPNMTSKHHPADMGMITSLKVGYKKNLLRNLFSVFDMEGGYQNAARQRAQAPRG